MATNTSKQTSELSDPLTYKQAYERLEVIVENIEKDDQDIDLLAEQVKEAVRLIDFCKAKIKTTDKTLDKIFGIKQ